MRNMKFFASVLALALPALAAAKSHGNRKDTWKYAGEDHGIRFFFKTEPGRGPDTIRLKLENTSDAQVDVAYRVMDMDWNVRFASSLGAHAADSSTVFRPRGGSPVRYPYFDEVYLDRDEDAAKAETLPAKADGPRRS